jgi:hypothetical protein
MLSRIIWRICVIHVDTFFALYGVDATNPFIVTLISQNHPTLRFIMTKPMSPLLTLSGRSMQYTLKKVTDFPVPSRMSQTLPGRE